MNDNIKKIIIETIDTHKKMTAEFEQSGIETIAAIAEAITKSLEQNGTVYLCGNGGSAADAQHIAGELIGRFTRERKALAAVALSTDTSILPTIMLTRKCLLGRSRHWLEKTTFYGPSRPVALRQMLLPPSN